tara:strand:+ start:1079 stop:2866 length:1788 start_codon:yes stop_codon:yes gene_type:complete
MSEYRFPDTDTVNTVVKYGDFIFHESGMPVPFVTMDQQMLNEHSGRWGRIDNITVNGVISGQHFSGTSNYGSGLIGLQSGLINGFSDDFKDFIIQDSGSKTSPTEIDTVYSGSDCIVQSISFEESRYNMLLGYTINLRAHQPTYFEHVYGVLDPVDEFSYDEQQEDEIVTLTHNVSARGFRTGDTQAFDNAKNFVIDRTGISEKIPSKFVSTGTCDTWVLKSQSETADRVNGSYSVTEVFEMDPSGCTGSILRYNCNIESGIQDDFVVGTIQGELNGGKTGSMTNLKDRFEETNIYQLFTGAINNSNLDFYAIPVTYSSEETTSTTKGDRKITFNASYNTDNLFNDGENTFFQYASGPSYFDYNLTINQDEVTEVTSVNIDGTIKSRGNLQERIYNSQKFLEENLLNHDNGTTRLKSLAQEGLDEIKSDLTSQVTHDLNVFPNSLSVVSGNKGAINISASFDNSDRIYDAKIRGSSYNIDVRTALPIYKPRPSVNENGVSAIYQTNVLKREVVNINGQIIPDYRSGSLYKDSTIEQSGSGIVNTIRTALVSGTEKRMESDTSNRSETDGALSFGTTYSFNSSGVYPKAMTYFSET